MPLRKDAVAGGSGGIMRHTKRLTCCVGTESAPVFARAVGGGAPGSARAAGAAGNARPTATSEHVTKFSKDEVAALTTPEQHSKDPSSGHWSEERQRKVRRLVSDPDP